MRRCAHVDSVAAVATSSLSLAPPKADRTPVSLMSSTVPERCRVVWRRRSRFRLAASAAGTRLFVFAHGAGSEWTILHGGVRRNSPYAASPLCVARFPYMRRGASRPDPPRRRKQRYAPPWPPRWTCFPGFRSLPAEVVRRPDEHRKPRRELRLPGVVGLHSSAFHFHPAVRPSQDRAVHCLKCRFRCCFCKVTRDSLAALDDLRLALYKDSARARRWSCSDANLHSFHVPVRTGGRCAGFGDVLDAWLRRSMRDGSAWKKPSRHRSKALGGRRGPSP